MKQDAPQIIQSMRMGAATENLTVMFGLIGLVVLVSALLSGLIERSSFPQIAVFLGLGAVVGPSALGLLDVGLDSSTLRMVATLSLALVLFTDALTIDVQEVRKHAGLAILILGPGTLIAAAIMAFAGVYLLNLPWPLAAILAAPLASTDPVMLRSLLKSPYLPATSRQALRLESALNDIVLLPIVLIAMAFLAPKTDASPHVAQILVQMFILGPGAGALVAWLGIMALDVIRKRIGIRRDYESLYSLGIALTAFAAAEAMHGSGFLAVFAAGLMISTIDVELCDCFREYGETTAEILLLFTFVLLGASLMWTGIGLITVGVALFVVVALLARPLGLLLSLAKNRASQEAKRYIVWYGPRGLSTLLLVLLPIFAGTPNSEPLFHVATVLVLASVVLHGGSMMIFGIRSQRPRSSAVVEAESPIRPLAPVPERLTPTEILLLMETERVWLADVRRDVVYLEATERIKDAVRLSPQFARRDASRQGLSKDALIATFCNCPDDKTAVRVMNELRSAGWYRAFAVTGGMDALLAAGFEAESFKAPV